MNINEQVRIMELQISHFDTLLEKLSWLSMAFDPDPSYSQEARNIVRGNLSTELKISAKLI